MPIPEKPKVFVDLWYLIPAHIRRKLDLINRTWDKDREACFEAGKKETIDLWPPPDKKKFCYHAQGQTFVVYYDHDKELWMFSCDDFHMEFYKSRHQTWLIGQWLAGKLLEVKDEVA